ncbi:MAG: hypothetical protein ACKOAX_07195 [Candidatus Kapaibacterium sp.]
MPPTLSDTKYRIRRSGEMNGADSSAGVFTPRNGTAFDQVDPVLTHI